jgi:hypothetical protein
MYGIFTYIWVIFRAQVGKYSIHGVSGSLNSVKQNKQLTRCLYLHVACQSSLQHGLLWAGPSEKHVVPSAGHIIYHRSPSQARLKPCFKLS